jgi:outer membrane protein assembly factor BamB
MKKILTAGLILTIVFFQIQPVKSQSTSNSWQQFRGNAKNGISVEDGILEKWPENGPEQVWKKEIGTSFSELLFFKNSIYTMAGEKIDSTSGFEYAAAFDASTGNEIWKTKLDSIFIDVDNWGDGARSTPALDGKSLYCLTSYGKLIAVSLENGKIKWQVDFVAEFGSTVPRWGFSTSPILIDNVLIVEVGGKEEHAFMGFNPEDGKQLWAKANGNSSYCSPAVANIGGINQVIFANGTNLYAFNARGESLWSYAMPLRSPTATPLFIPPNRIFVSAVSPTGSFIIEINGDEIKEVMNNSSMKNHWSSSCYLDGYIYGFNVAALQCISAETGEKMWTKRGYGKGSLILVDGKLIVLSDQGKLILVEATHESYKEISAFQALEGKSWTAPSFANGKVFLRNLTEMACYKLK